MKKKIFLIISFIFMFFLTTKISASEKTLVDYNLGYHFTNSYTDFYFYSPASTNVKLNIYKLTEVVNEEEEDEEDEEEQESIFEYVKTQHNLSLVDGISGLWRIKISENLEYNLYDYEITTLNGTYSVVDPYVKYLNTDKDKGIIVDHFNAVVENFDSIKYLLTYDESKLIYGIHTKDFTNSQTWTGTNEYRGKFLGLVETKTNLNNKLVGFDYVNSLSPTHIELMPVYEFGDYDYYYGSKSLYPFSISRNYSTNSENLSPSLEFSQAVKSFYNNGMGVILKVDLLEFHPDFVEKIKIIDPLFFLSNNQINFENIFVQKYITDFFNYYQKEYKIAGFNVVNLNKYPTNLIKNIISNLQQENSDVMFYGTNLTGENSMENISGIRNLDYSLLYSLLGDLNSITDNGLLGDQFSKENFETLKYVLLSGLSTLDIDYDIVKNLIYKDQWIKNNTFEIINTFSSYEGLSFYDKLKLQSYSDEKIEEKIKLSLFTLFISGGIPYINSGDEFLNSKSYQKPVGSTELFCNSDDCFYTYLDGVNNAIDWSKAVKNYANIDFINKLRQLKLSIGNSLKGTVNDLSKNLSIFYENDYFIAINMNNPDANENSKDNSLIFINFKNEEVNFELEKTKKKWYEFYIEEKDSSKFSISSYKFSVNDIAYGIVYSIKQPKIPNAVSLVVIILVIGGVGVINMALGKKVNIAKNKDKTKEEKKEERKKNRENRKLKNIIGDLVDFKSLDFKNKKTKEKESTDDKLMENESNKEIDLNEIDVKEEVKVEKVEIENKAEKSSSKTKKKSKIES